MTEAEWLRYSYPLPMLVQLLDCKVSDRKARLFACACVRTIWQLIPDGPHRRLVEIAEQFADNEATKEDLVLAYQLAGRISNAYLDDPLPFDMVVAYAHNAAENAGSEDRVKFECYCWREVQNVILSETFMDDNAIARDGIFQAQSDFLRDIFGNPFRSIEIDPAWVTPTVIHLAQSAYEKRALPAGTLENDRLAILADALEEAGCGEPEILGHLRGPGPHVCGCHVLDLCLGLA